MRIRTCLAFTAIFLINILGPLRWIKFDFVVVDLAETVYHVKELAQGRIPYRDIFSHHTLGYLLPFRLVELFTPVTPDILKIMCILFNFMSCVLVYCIIKSLGFRRAALWGALVTATIGWFPQWGGDTFNNQSYSLPLCYLTLLLLIRSQKTSSGELYLYAWLAFGGMLTFDHRLLVFTPVMGLPVLCRTIRFDWPGLLRAMMAGILIPSLALSWLAWHGALFEGWQQTVVFPLLYRNQGQSDLITVLSELIVGHGILDNPVVALLFLCGIFCILKFERDRFLRLLIQSWLVLGLVYLALGGRDYPHYLLILAPCVLLAISLIPEYLRGKSPNVSNISRALTFAAILAGFLPFLTEYHNTGSIFVEPDRLVISETASFVKQNSQESDDILVWGYGPAIYLLSERFSNFRDMGLISVAGANYTSTRLGDQGLVPLMVDEFKKYLIETPPKLFVFYQKNNIDCRSCFGVAPLQLNFDFNKVAHLNYLREFLFARCTRLKVFDSALDRAEVYSCKSRASV